MNITFVLNHMLNAIKKQKFITLAIIFYFLFSFNHIINGYLQSHKYFTFYSYNFLQM